MNAGPLFMGSEVYRGSSYGPGHPLRIPRVPVVTDLCRALGWLPPERFRTAPRARPAALTLWHTPAYITALERAEAIARGATAVPGEADHLRHAHGLGTLSNPLYPEMFRRPATGAGGALWAAEWLATRDRGAVHVPGAGTHHGLPDRASGFCYLNDVVLALKGLQRGGLSRLAYVDIDAHAADGVELAFADDPQVLVISVHEEGRWPFTSGLEDRGCGNVYNLPVPRGLNDSAMALIRDRLILPLVAAHAPQAIVLQAGADALAEDPLSRLALSNNAHLAVMQGLRALAPRLMVTGGGGYNPWSVGRAWALLWAGLTGAEIPDRLPPEAAAVLAALSWQGGGRPPPAPHMLSTLRDPPREGPIPPEIPHRIERLLSR